MVVDDSPRVNGPTQEQIDNALSLLGREHVEQLLALGCVWPGTEQAIEDEPQSRRDHCPEATEGAS
jgi:hypothetical protein